jgi:hypothetical protein
MMQNGFRRLALAQGLLPARPPPPDVPAQLKAFDAPPSSSAAAPQPPSDTWDSEAEMWAASAE